MPLIRAPTTAESGASEAGFNTRGCKPWAVANVYPVICWVNPLRTVSTSGSSGTAEVNYTIAIPAIY